MSSTQGPKPYVLVVDDQVEILDIIKHILVDEGYEVVCVSDSRKIVECVRMRQPDAVLLDVWLNDSRFDGVAIFDIIKQYYDDVPVIMISGHSSVDTAVKALKMGVFDFITKPFSTEQLLGVMSRALDVRRLRREYALLQSENALDICFNTSVPIWQTLQKSLLRAAEGRSRVLLRGEVGSGKYYAAQFIHKNSSYAQGPFLHFDAALYVNDADGACADLFGEECHNQHERSAVNIGVFERAARGTVYITNIDLLHKDVQKMLLQVLQERNFVRRGGKDNIPLEVRLITSTSRDMDRVIQLGRFAQNLYDRLNVVSVDVPPLRELGGELVKVMTSYIQHYLRRDVKVVFDRSACFAMESYSWPGNIREVANVAEWLVMTVPVSDEHFIVNASVLGARLGASASDDDRPVGGRDGGFDITRALALPMRNAREYFEQYYLDFHLKRHNRNYSRTAEVVGMERTALHRKMRQLGREKD